MHLVQTEATEACDGELVDAVTANGAGPVVRVTATQDQGEAIRRPLDRSRGARRLGLVVYAPRVVARVWAWRQTS